VTPAISPAIAATAGIPSPAGTTTILPEYYSSEALIFLCVKDGNG